MKEIEEQTGEGNRVRDDRQERGEEKEDEKGEERKKEKAGQVLAPLMSPAGGNAQHIFRLCAHGGYFQL